MCHYTRAHTAFEHILPSRELKMNPYSKMRDPFESKRPAFHVASAWGHDEDAQMELFWAVQDAVGRSRDTYRLLSLTQGDEPTGNPLEQPFRFPWSRARMWEQYAENHAGVCLVFDREELLETLGRNLAKNGSYEHGPVKYTIAGFADSDAARISLEHFRKDSLEEDIGLHVQRHHRDFFFLKTADWESESEYRFVWERAATSSFGRLLPLAHYVSYGNALRLLVVGEGFPDWQIPGAQDAARHVNVELRRMTWELDHPFPAKPRRRRWTRRVRKLRRAGGD